VGEDTREIEREIQAERRDLGQNLDDLQSRARALTDWRTHYANHTGATLALAFGGGMALALLARRPRRPESQEFRPEHQQTRVGFSALKALGDRPRARQQVTDTWDHMLEALVAVASVKAAEWVGSFVPGFRDEYDTRAHGRPLP
jgi:hypothetical protein